ncbi:hypothetical protein CesoFtcFv8_025656 [Champsocephalus esox]|uniref:Uncharacterized protein n=1 Tax=Champsocephalus esox TaxID=159716 RepID=A0AAN8B184_9TELE|nr:hypothetical protein CesoFtcFv8_025656 [Champsocephalus esox]
MNRAAASSTSVSCSLKNTHLLSCLLITNEFWLGRVQTVTDPQTQPCVSRDGGGLPLRGPEARCSSAPWPMHCSLLVDTDADRALQSADLRLTDPQAAQ